MANRIEFKDGYKYTYDERGNFLKKEKWAGKNTKPSSSSSTTEKPFINKNKASDRRSAVAEKSKGKVYKAGEGFVDRKGKENTYRYERKTQDDKQIASDVQRMRQEASWQNQYQTEEDAAHFSRLEDYSKNGKKEQKKYTITEEDEKKAKKGIDNVGVELSGRISDNYSKMEDEAKAKATLAKTVDEQLEWDSKAKAYKEKAKEYNAKTDINSQYLENISFTDAMYESDEKKDDFVRIGELNDDFLLDIKNNNADFVTFSSAISGSVNTDDSLRSAALVMSDDEKKKYYYTRGKYGEDAARNYVKALYDVGDLGERFSKQTTNVLDKIEEVSDPYARNTIGSALAFIEGFTSLGESIQGIGTSIQEAVDGEVHYNDLVSERVATKIVNLEREKTGNIGIDIARAVGQMLPAIAVSVATMGAGAPAVVANIASSATTFGTTYGKTYVEERRKGYDAQDAATYSSIIGGLEAGLQYVLNGVSLMGSGMITSKIASKALGAINKMALNPVARKAFSFMVTSGINSSGEFSEEFLQGFFEPLVRNVVLNENNEIDFINPDNFYQGGIGALVAFLMNVPTSVSGVGQYTANAEKIGQSLTPEQLREQIKIAKEGTEAKKDADFIVNNYTDEEISNGKVNPVEAGMLVLDNATNAQNDSNLSSYINGDTVWNGLSDSVRSYVVDPKNADVVSEQLGVEINSSMTPQEIRAVIAEKHTANKNINDSQSEIIDYMSGDKSWDNVSDITKNILIDPKNANVLAERTGLNINSEMTQQEILKAIDDRVKDIQTSNRVFDNPLTESDITQSNAEQQAVWTLEENAKAARYELEAEMNKNKSALHRELRDSIKAVKDYIKKGDVDTAGLALDIMQITQNQISEAEASIVDTHYKNKEAKKAELSEKRKVRREYRSLMKRLISREANKRKTTERKLIHELKKLQNNQKSVTGDKYKARAKDILDLVGADRLFYTNKRKNRALTIAEAITQFQSEHNVPIDSKLLEEVKTIEKKTVRDLDDKDLYSFYKLVKHLNHMQKMENRLLLHDKVVELKTMQNNVIRDMNKAPKHADNKLARIYTLHSLTPTTFFNDLEGHTGKSWSLIADDINNGFVKQEVFKHEIADVVNETTDQFKRKNLQKMFGRKAEVQNIELTNAKGETTTLSLTSGEKIALYMNSLNADNMRHLLGMQILEDGSITYDGTGGIIVPNHELMQKGKKAKAIEAGTTHKLTLEQVEQIKNSMTENEMKFVKMFQDVYSRCQEAINETSVNDKGFEIADVENYYPIITKKFSIVGDFAFDTNGIAPENASPFKSRGKDSTTAILLNDALETMFRHVNQVSAYYGINEPLKNLRSVFNNESVQKSIKANYGYSDAPIKYIETLIKDLGIGHKEITGLDILRGNFAKAALGLNPSVALSQLSAYPAAAIVLDSASLVKGIGIDTETKSKKEIIRKYSPLYRTREAGHTDVDISNIADINKSKMKKNSNWIVQMDLLTVRRLWGACEAQVRTSNPDLAVGTEEYYEAVGKLHTEVIQKTQVNTSVMQTNPLQRSPIGRMAFMFRSESFKNFNILANAFSELRAANARYKASKTKEAKLQLNAARKKVAVATTSQILSAASFAGIKAAIAAAFDNEWEEEDEKKYIDKFFENFGFNFLNSFAGNFIGGSEIMAMTSRFTGIGYENNFIQIPAIDNINAIADAVADMEVIGKYINGEAKANEVYRAIKNFAKLTGNFIGVPIGSIEKYTTAIVGGISPEFKTWYENLNYGVDSSDLKHAKDNTEAKLVAETMLKNTSPQVAATKAGDDIASLLSKHRNDEDVSATGVMLTNISKVTFDKQEIVLTPDEKKKVNSFANKLYKDYANSLFNSDGYKNLDDKEKISAYTYLADKSEADAKYKILKELGYNPKDERITNVNIGDYAAYKIKTKGSYNERTELTTLIDLNISQDSKKQIYEKEFGKFTDLMNDAVDSGMTVDETISAQTAMKWIDETSTRKKADKIDWILDNASSVNELSVLYTHFVENASDYHDTLEYATKQGVRPEAFIQREAELNGLEYTREYSIYDDLVYKDGELTTQTDTTSTSDNTKKNKAQLLADGDYTDAELVYFWQKEYPSDDDFAIAAAINVPIREYIKYYAAQEASPNKKEVIGLINTLNLDPVQKVAMRMFANKSYSVSVAEQRAVVQLVLGQKMATETKRKVLEQLGFSISKDGNIYREKS